jgi:hypothetical protein
LRNYPDGKRVLFYDRWIDEKHGGYTIYGLFAFDSAAAKVTPIKIDNWTKKEAADGGYRTLALPANEEPTPCPRRVYLAFEYVPALKAVFICNGANQSAWRADGKLVCHDLSDGAWRLDLKTNTWTKIDSRDRPPKRLDDAMDYCADTKAFSSPRCVRSKNARTVGERPSLTAIQVRTCARRSDTPKHSDERGVARSTGQSPSLPIGRSSGPLIPRLRGGRSQHEPVRDGGKVARESSEAVRALGSRRATREDSRRTIVADCSLASCQSGGWDGILSSAETDSDRSYSVVPVGEVE